MTYHKLVVDKTELGAISSASSDSPPSAGPAEVLVEVERFALSANNISYAVTGEMLGYWSYFPEEDGSGCVPVWGVARVVESNTPELAVGEQIFGYLPMASHLLLTPSAVTDLCFTDATAHRRGLHPWYNRYYRCAQDPAYAADTASLQSVLWALFMTGWMMADDLKADTGAVVVSSASSKTALSLAWSLRRRQPDVEVVGLTSERNHAFVEARGVYHRVLSYDDVARLSEVSEQATYVDIAGNAQVTSAAHVALGDRLNDSVLIGGTHRAPADALPMPGPAPRFFFIPDVAEARAGEEGFERYHEQFALAWRDYAAWSAEWLQIDSGAGPEQIMAAYGSLLAGGLAPDSAMVFAWA